MVGFPNHLESHELLPSYQSAYRQDYSTETLLLKIYNDILWDMEQQKISPFIAIDLSAAFDTVDHGKPCVNLQSPTLVLTCQAQILR